MNAIVKTEATLINTIDGDTLAEMARALGAKVGTNVTSAIDFVVKAKEDYMGGAFRVLFGLQADFDPDELDGFAVPDSDTGMNPDEFKVTKEDGKGKRKLVNSNFYVNFADGTPGGQALLSRIEMVERMADKNAMKDDIPDDIKAFDPHERETQLAFLKGRRSTMRASIKNAMALYFKLKEVNDYPGVMAEPIYVKGKTPEDCEKGTCDIPEVENTPKCIAVWLVPDEGRPIAKWEALSIGEFKKLRPAKGIEKGGTFAALMESGVEKKKPGTGSKSDKPEGLTIKTVELGMTVFAEFHRWLDEVASAKDKVEYGKLLKLGNSKDNDEFISALVETRNYLDNLAKEVSADAKYVKLQQGGSDLATKAA